ncbi:unnamed protein product [Cyprideis torosa]|uniref:Uncharacterized protein n=1 Tax=Cyprideis torosa TaxID=163714 RepID=A0A7R8WLD2_9CRUS|nr:unnamed protein product [Cyprideis torosa]CAG0897112.1 unnamed protein product [Cyprideis torosa]
MSSRSKSEGVEMSSRSKSEGLEREEGPDPTTYRNILSNVPSAVVVITTSDDQEDKDQRTLRGFTCSSFNSVSLQPPIISFCVRRPSRTADLIHRAQKFAVNFLSADQVPLSIHFATPHTTEKKECQFAKVSHDISPDGIPILRDISAVLICDCLKVDVVGDHSIWYGNVHNAQTFREELSPLIYHSRRYRSIGDELFMTAFETQTLFFEDWTHEAHIRMAWNYIRDLGRDAATSNIKEGILKFNAKNYCKVDRGYHETVTLFYIHMVTEAISRTSPPAASFESFIESNQHLLDRGLLFHYYSKETINNPESMKKFFPPDINPLPEIQ